MTREQIEFRKAFHAGMDAGVVYVYVHGNKAYRDDNHDKGPYVLLCADDNCILRLEVWWDDTDWRPLTAEPSWKPEPFERVIGRRDEIDEWACDFFSSEKVENFECVGSMWNQIAPYAGNEDCVGTTKPAKNTLKK